MVGRGPTLPETFEQVALGVFALLADPASVEERDAREVRAHGSASGTLLVNWLNECLYVLDVEGFVPRRVEFTILALDASAPGGEPLRLHCRLHGRPQPVPPSRGKRCADPHRRCRGARSWRRSEARVITQGDDGPKRSLNETAARMACPQSSRRGFAGRRKGNTQNLGYRAYCPTALPALGMGLATIRQQFQVEGLGFIPASRSS